MQAPAVHTIILIITTHLKHPTTQSHNPSSIQHRPTLTVCACRVLLAARRSVAPADPLPPPPAPPAPAAPAAAVMQWIKAQYEDFTAELKQMRPRHLLMQGVNLGLVVTSALIIWKTLMLVTGSESPVVVVLSGSMEPGFHRGDILFLNMGTAPVRTGEVVVFNINGRDIPIVHRVIKVHERAQQDHVDILTKGDNNYGDDRLLYARGQEWLHREHIMGRAVGFLPHVGMVTIMMNDYPMLKYGLIAVLGILVITSKE